MIQTAVQQIMLGSVTGSEKDAHATLEAVRSAGYGGIELNRFMIHPTSLMVRLLTRAAGMPTGKSGNLDWPSLMKEHCLTVPSLHTDLGSLEKEMPEVVKDAKAFGTDRLVITGMYRFDYRNTDTVKELAQRLNNAGKKLQEEGISLLYHNHNIELLRTPSGKRAFDILLEETDPRYLNFELDTYWLADAGADPLAWMKKMGDRMKLWHINDRGTKVEKTPMTPILKSDSMELGYGNMDLDLLADQAKKNGVQAIILESHRNWAQGSPVKSLQLSAPLLMDMAKD